MVWWVPLGHTRDTPLPTHVCNTANNDYQAPVVQTLGSAILWINHYPVVSVILISVILTHWIVIYPVDSAIQCLNNGACTSNYSWTAIKQPPLKCEQVATHGLRLAAQNL